MQACVCTCVDRQGKATEAAANTGDVFMYGCRYIESLIDAEVASGIPSDRIVVAGFSQGGAVAMLMLRSKHKLAGVVGECMCQKHCAHWQLALTAHDTKQHNTTHQHYSMQLHSVHQQGTTGVFVDVCQPHLLVLCALTLGSSCLVPVCLLPL